MLPGFEKIVEERIRQAQMKGEFKNLPGSGKPLELEDDRHIPEELRLAYKALKNANFIPPEIEIRKEICRAEDLLAHAEDEAERYRIIKKINVLIMKFNTLRNTSAAFEVPQKYMLKLTERIK